MEIGISDHGSDVVVGVVSNAVYALAILALNRLRGGLERQDPRLRQVLWLVALLIFIGGNLFVLTQAPALAAWTFAVSSIALGLGLWSELRQFWRLGIIGADRSIRGGIDFKRSLSLCRNSLDFLGIGAQKLIASRSEFEAAMRRCQRPDRPVRFLLSAPDNPKLEEMARRAGTDRQRYQNAVRESLVVLAGLKINEALNVEVRIYEELPLFRLMFVDHALCLASHYVFSEGDGSQLPQLHLRRRVGLGRDVESLYYPFELYFEDLWKRAKSCDLTAYLARAK